ncbi:MAG TPA: hypothetical protein VJM83_03565, partial [Nitrospirota bacterium]|nr:hypothetical protein [Nitrospirota bacterium]
LRERGVRNFAEARAGPVPPEAVKLAEDASKLKPYDDGCRRFLAGLYEGRGEPRMAEGEYKEAIRLNPYYPFHYRDLGLFYLKAGDGGKAAESFQKAAERYPASEELKKYIELARKTAGRPPQVKWPRK